MRNQERRRWCSGALVLPVAIALAACGARPDLDAAPTVAAPVDTTAVSVVPPDTTMAALALVAPAAAAPPVEVAPSVPDGVAAVNAPQPEIPVSALVPHEQPPQFVVVSFDGACRDDLFDHYLDLAERTSARFTFFVSGLCLLPEAERLRYDAPNRRAGQASAPFAAASDIPERIRNLTTAYSRGHEIASHALGHFCDEGGEADWTADDWRSEMAQFDALLDGWATHLGPELAADVAPLPFNASVIEGIRTPCLLGDRDAMWPVWEEWGLTYDASDPTGAPEWPHRIRGRDFWQFPLQTIDVAGYGTDSLTVDYSLMCRQNDCAEHADPDTVHRIATSTYDSYIDALHDLCTSSRAPLFLGNHFNSWVGGAYVDALTRFVEDAAGVCPEVRFVTNRDLVRWLEAQDASVLEQLQARDALDQS